VARERDDLFHNALLAATRYDENQTTGRKKFVGLFEADWPASFLLFRASPSDRFLSLALCATKKLQFALTLLLTRPSIHLPSSKAILPPQSVGYCSLLVSCQPSPPPPSDRSRRAARAFYFAPAASHATDRQRGETKTTQRKRTEEKARRRSWEGDEGGRR
jgi:hypothetical protein